MIDEQVIPEEILAMRALLAGWLGDPDAPLDRLVAWLQGYGLPVGGEEEPYIWLLRGLPLTRDRKKSRALLAQRVAATWENRPELNRLGRQHNKFLYGLLMLSAELERPDDLNATLYRLYEDNALTGDYGGLDLRAALRTALAENQIDARLTNEWFAMLEKTGTARLPGGPYQGFEGVLLMPQAPSERGRPYFDALGQALATMSRHLEGDSRRRPKFRALLESVSEKFNKPPSLDHQLLVQADKHSWQKWAWQSLPSLVVVIPHVERRVLVLLWRVYCDLIPVSSSTTGRALLGGEVLELEMSEDIANRVLPSVRSLDNGRYQNPYFSELSTYRVMSHLLRGVTQDTAGDMDFTAVQQKREELAFLVG